MKKTGLLAAAAVLMMAAPASANGYLGLEYGNADLSFGGPSGDVDVWQGEGAFGWTSGNWGGQVGGSLGNVDGGSGDADFWTLNGHVYWDAGSWRIGGVVATTSIDESSNIEEWAYGLEALFETSANSNIVGSLTMGDVDGDADLWNFDIGGNFYTSPNVRFGGFVGFGNIDPDSTTDADTMSYGLNTEFQPWSAPVSITLGWNHFEIDDVGVDSDTLQVGARWNFGGGTIQDRNNAAPFDTHTGYLNRFYGIW